MGLMKDRHGTYYARKRVPKALEAAVATVLANGSKKSLGTKRPHEARIRVKPVLMAFDRVLADAAALLKQQPLRTTLTQAEIDRIVEYHFATTLAGDEDERREGTGNEELVASIAQQLTEAGIEFEMPLPLAPRPAYASLREKWPSVTPTSRGSFRSCRTPWRGATSPRSASISRSCLPSSR